ncbi:hypothetical protein KL951_002853 [Ogataea haglerorum]|nr:hypothetical protein KL951_002853 [Ogataea haglerorum]
MPIYSFWIYDRHCNCIFSREYGTGSQDPSCNVLKSTPKSKGSAQFAPNPSYENTSSLPTSSQSTQNSSISSGRGQRLLSSASNNHKAQELIQKGTVNAQNNNNTSKLLFGTLFSLRKIAGSVCTPQTETHQEEEFNTSNLNSFNALQSFRTLNYKCHYYETMNGLRFVVVTHPAARSLQSSLIEIYHSIYLPTVVRNPLMPVNYREDEVISNDRFVRAIDEYWASLEETLT